MVGEISRLATDDQGAHRRRTIATESPGPERRLRRHRLPYSVFSVSLGLRGKFLRQRNMNQTYIDDLPKHVGEEVTLKGWLYNLRSSGKLMFPQLRDGTGIVQGVVAKNSVTPELWDALRPLGQESALIVIGRVREDGRAPGGFEIDVTDA